MNPGLQAPGVEAGVEAARMEMFCAFCALLDQEGIEYAILAGYERYPAHIDSDVDFMISAADFDRLPALFGRADCIPGSALVQMLQHQPTSRYFVFARQVGCRLAFLHPDAACDYRLDARLWLRSDRVLASRRKSALGFWIPAAAVGFEYYLIKRIVDKALCEAVHLARLQAALDEDAAGCGEVLARLFPPATAKAVAAAILGGDVAWFAREMTSLRRLVVSTPALESPGQRLAGAVAEWRRWALRIVQPTGIVLTILGPDGSGKSTLLNHIEREFAPAFRQVRCFHLRPRFGITRPGMTVTDPHGSPPRGWILSCLKVAVFVVDYLWSWVRCVWPASVQSTLVLFDRYFHDLLVDPRRYRLPMRFFPARWAARLIPQPDIWLVLTAPAEVLRARKDEIPIETARELVLGYEAMAARLQGAVLIQTAQPLEDVLTQAVAAVRRLLQSREAGRMPAIR